MIIEWADVELVDGPRHGHTMGLPADPAGRPPANFCVIEPAPIWPVRDHPFGPLYADYGTRLTYVRTGDIHVVEEPLGGPPVKRWLYRYEV